MRVGSAWAGVAALLLMACTASPHPIEWAYPGSAEDDRARELVVREGRCSGEGDVLYRARFQPGQEVDAVGQVGDAPWAFEARVFDESCRVVLSGCSDVSAYGPVRLELEPVDDPPGCPAGHACEAGGCREIEAPDEDGDGYPRPDDCDDADRNRHPDAVETCDAAEVDENCNGAANEGCLCHTGETRSCGELTTGTCEMGVQRCEDGVWGSTCDGLVSPTTEVCNGRDDDCDDEPDDGFDCVAGEPTEGTTLCGNPLTRTCPDDCTWDPTADETVETCDYCDDTGAGFGSEGGERRLADETIERSIYADTRGDYVHPYLVKPSGEEQRSAILFEPIAVGYGTLSYRARVWASVDGDEKVEAGWGLVMFEAAVGRDVLPPSVSYSSFRGLGPADRNGLAVEWWYDPHAYTEEDGIMVRRLVSDGTDRGAAFVRPPREAWLDEDTPPRRQEMILEVDPDDPDTPENDTRIRVFAHSTETEPVEVWRCCAEESCDDACRTVVSPGTEYTLGLLAAGTSNRIDWEAGHLLRLEGLCPSE